MGFWEAVGSALAGPSVTDWMQALGAVVAVPIAIWAGRQGQKAKKASIHAEEGSAKANEAAETALGSRNEMVNEQLERGGSTVWRIERDGRNIYRFVNGGRVSVKLIDAVDVSEGMQDAAMLLPGFEETYMSPGNGFKVLIEKSLASPAVTKIRVTWQEGPREISQVYAV